MEQKKHSLHIGAQIGEIAETILLPGDPLRAKWIADTFLTDVTQYNSLRGMLGFTGTTPEGKKISVQGSGMGMPSLSIYVNELINTYKVKTIIRVGTAGGLSIDVPCRSIIMAMGACTDSALNTHRFSGMNFAPIADWSLLKQATDVASKMNLEVQVGNIVSVDKFYEDTEPYTWKLFAQYGTLAIEMETAELYTLAAKSKIRALTILTISDNLVIEDHMSPEDRENTLEDMMRIAIQLA